MNVYRDNEKGRMIVINRPMEGYIEASDIQYLRGETGTVWKELNRNALIHFPNFAPRVKSDFWFYTYLDSNIIKAKHPLSSKNYYGWKRTKLRLNKKELDKEIRKLARPCLLLPTADGEAFFKFGHGQDRFKELPLTLSLVKIRNYGTGEARLYSDPTGRMYIGDMPYSIHSPFESLQLWDISGTRETKIKKFINSYIEEIV